MKWLNFRSRLSLLAAFTLIWPTLASPIHAAVAEAPAIELPRWGTGDKVQLADFAGQIVVLDFFAYWCAPCKKASGEVERGIQKYYAGKKGNVHGVPVRVVSINIERAKPNLTAEFIKELDLEFVLNDFDGLLLEKLGAASTPFLMILDGTRATQEKPAFRVLYQNEGYAGTKKLREVIDGIKPAPTGGVKSSHDEASAIEKATGPPTTHKAEAAFEAMLATDIQITSTALNYGQKTGNAEWNIGYTHRSLAQEYEPFRRFDFLGYSERLLEDYNGGQGAWRQKMADALTVNAAAGVYEGFTDFRSLWLANYYKQQFNFFPDYREPEPRGFNAFTGLRWEYQPTTGFAEAGFLYANDEIAPGYEMDPITGDLLRGREILHTHAPSLKFENVLTARIRVLNEIGLAITSGREARHSYRGSINVALGERWTWRSSGGYTHEDPALRAWFAGSTLEFEIAPKWLVSISALHYRDTGEIENSRFISTAAPGLQTWRTGAGLRYAGENFSFHLSAAPTWADYEPVEVGTRPFTNLYQDRAWLSVMAALLVEL